MRKYALLNDHDLMRKYALLNDFICHKFYFWFDIDIYCLICIFIYRLYGTPWKRNGLIRMGMQKMKNHLHHHLKIWTCPQDLLQVFFFFYFKLAPPPKDMDLSSGSTLAIFFFFKLAPPSKGMDVSSCSTPGIFSFVSSWNPLLKAWTCPQLLHQVFFLCFFCFMLPQTKKTAIEELSLWDKHNQQPMKLKDNQREIKKNIYFFFSISESYPIIQLLQTWISKRGYGCKGTPFFLLFWNECEMTLSLELSGEKICVTEHLV